ncbi:D-alanyl-D-alanine carboxypeptidase family protein [Nocardiopsis sp. FIRDI 009]|uniref:M15 family metallopeptidase n=1 Tax=Nocardiopsis sp. FIRDI 009 TaxID=714197 RepID=UPI000E223A80|nr:M15 family metallopeptidase [Nocardiopsis sp. FIRDI 009]
MPRTPSRPSSYTVGTDPWTERPHEIHRAFSVNTVLTWGTALLLVLLSAAPGTARGASEPAEEAELDAVRVELAALRAELADLRGTAVDRIEDYRHQAERLAEVSARREAADERAATARARREDARLAAARQAATVYKGGAPHPAAAWFGGPEGLLERGAYLTLLTGHRTAELDRAEAARVAAGTLADLARGAEEDQTEAAEAAAAARERAEAALSAQEERFEELLDERSRLEELLAESRPAPRTETSTEVTEEAQGADGTGGARKVDTGHATAAPHTPTCAGGDGGGHANGRLPASALCPLPQPGEHLRPDAAAAFVGLDAAYQERFGRPMCVADSYRPYHEQVLLFHQMLPGMAARPGTSQHGLGLAVDLCGGVHELGSPEHTWMLSHAPAHGWVNPDWARGGFEPWHWEFTG